MDRIELIAKFLETCSRQEDRDRETAPTLKRCPKDENSWKGWLGFAKRLAELLDKNEHKALNPADLNKPYYT